MRRIIEISRIALTVKLLATFLTGEALAASPPAPAAKAGYTVHSLSSTFDASTVDLANSGKSGFQWYPFNFFGRHANTSAILPSNGLLTLQGDTTGPNGQLATARVADNGTGFTGTAFGGGAYIEASLKFNPDDVESNHSRGWPAFWAMAAEHLFAAQEEQWEGMPSGFKHFIEVDFMEYDLLSQGRNYYGGNLHDWYGVHKKTCPAAFCHSHLPLSKVKLRTPEGTDFAQFHQYGFLWIPATDAQEGTGQFYFDGRPIGEATHWQKFNDESAPPTGHAWEFGILDEQHLVLLLGTGVNEPMTVKSVDVWQSSTTRNSTH